MNHLRKTKKPIVQRMEDSDALAEQVSPIRKQPDDKFAIQYIGPGRFIVIPKNKIKDPTKLLGNLFGKPKNKKFKDPVQFLTSQDVHLNLDAVKLVKEVRRNA